MENVLPQASDFEARVRESFNRQRMMTHLGASMTRVVAGEAHLSLPFSEGHTQQHGYVHAGAITSILDSACGYAALTLLPAGHEVVTVEFKVNFLAPARGTSFRAIGRVLKSGRKLTVCSGEAISTENGKETVIAVIQATMIAVAT